MWKRIRWGHPRPPDLRKKSLKKAAATGADVAKTSLVALKESADAFPPLKGVTGSVLAVWNIAERAKASKGKAKAIAERCYEILKVLADAVPDPSQLPPEMQVHIQTFAILLGDIRRSMEPVQTRTRFRSLLNLNRTEDKLDGFIRRLDEAYQAFMLAAILRTEVKQCRTEVKLLDIQREVANTSVKLKFLDHGQHHTKYYLSTVSVGLF